MGCGCGKKKESQAYTVRQFTQQTTHTNPRPVQPNHDSRGFSRDVEVHIGDCGCQNPIKACIPHYTVETKEEARQYKNAFVDVMSTGDLYWIDADGIPTLNYKRIKYEDDHEAKEGKFADKQVIDQANGKLYYYMPDGSVYHINLERSV